MSMRGNTITETVRAAWSRIPAPPPEDLRYMAWGWGEDAARTFTGVAPVDVDISSSGFFACTPLFDLPPPAAAAYLGTFLLGLLRGLELQERTGVFHDILTRAHVLTCLQDERFWEIVIRPHLPPECREALVALSSYLVPRRDLLALTEEEANRIQAFALAA